MALLEYHSAIVITCDAALILHVTVSVMMTSLAALWGPSPLFDRFQSLGIYTQQGEVCVSRDRSRPVHAMAMERVLYVDKLCEVNKSFNDQDGISITMRVCS